MLYTSFNFMVFFRRQIMFKTVYLFGLYNEDCFDWVESLFNSRICVCECPVRVNRP